MYICAFRAEFAVALSVVKVSAWSHAYEVRIKAIWCPMPDCRRAARLSEIVDLEREK